MKKLIICSVLRTYIRLLIVVLVLAIVIFQVSAFAQTCLSIVKTPINVDGIVVGTAVIGGGGLPSGCSVDPGWADILSQNFTVFGAQGTPPKATIFLAGYNASSDAMLDTIYLGVHIEGDPDLRNLDRLTLYFDADCTDGLSWMDNKDFALFYEIGPETPIVTGETCNVLIEKPEPEETDTFDFIDPKFYRYNTALNGWVQQDMMPAGITSKISWDYDNTNDPEYEIWELEISIDVSDLELNVPSSGAGFRVGAKLYLHEIVSGNSWTVWSWPIGLTTESDDLAYDPDEGNVFPNNLEKLNVGAACGDVVFWPDGTSGITVTDAYGNSNKFTCLTDSDFNSDGSAKIKNHFTARVKFFNPTDLADNSLVTVPNTGKVKFSIKPWNSGFLGKYPMGEPTVEFNHFNQEKTVQLDWPQTKNKYDDPGTHQPKNHLENSGHSCLQVELDGFNPNLNEASDVHYRNLTYISASTVNDTFLISAVGVEAPPGVETLEYILRVKSSNIPIDQLDPEFQKSLYISKSKTVGASKTLKPQSPSYADVEEPFITYRKEKWNFTFTNAKEIGLQSLGNGYFSMPIKIGEEKLVNISITGGEMPVKPNQYTLSPRAGGTMLPSPSGDPPLDISVQPGKMVTIIANGLINVAPQNEHIHANGPNGFSYLEWTNSNFLLPSRYYDPFQNVGALIASFDDFETSFVVGADKTFIVPEGVSKFSLAVNDVASDYDDNTGNGFRLNVIITDPLFLPTRLAAPGNPELGLPPMPRVASNLPGFNVNAFQAIEIEGEEAGKLLRPTGYVAYAAYASHPQWIKVVKPFEIVIPFAGWFLFDDNLSLEDGNVYGARLGYRFTNQLTFELEGGITFMEDTVGEKGNIIQAMANLRYDILPLRIRRWAPYITVGAGYVFARGFGTDDESFAFQGGIGSTYRISNSFGARIDAKLFRINKLFGTGNTTNYQVTGGLVFWF